MSYAEMYDFYQLYQKEKAKREALQEAAEQLLSSGTYLTRTTRIYNVRDVQRLREAADE